MTSAARQSSPAAATVGGGCRRGTGPRSSGRTGGRDDADRGDAGGRRLLRWMWAARPVAASVTLDNRFSRGHDDAKSAGGRLHVPRNPEGKDEMNRPDVGAGGGAAATAEAPAARAVYPPGPLALNFRAVEMTDEQLARFCADNRDLRIELTSERELNRDAAREHDHGLAERQAERASLPLDGTGRLRPLLRFVRGIHVAQRRGALRGRRVDGAGAVGIPRRGRAATDSAASSPISWRSCVPRPTAWRRCRRR